MLKNYAKLLISLIKLCFYSTANAQIITTIAGTITNGCIGNSIPATDAQLDAITGVTADKYGNIYLVSNICGLVRKIDAAGIITTIGGGGTSLLDSIPATDAAIYCEDITADDSGNVYVTNTGNYVIQKITTATGIIKTIAGTGINGFSGMGGPATAAQIGGVLGISIDKKNNIYLSDRGNNRIYKINSAGIIHTIAGNGTYGYNGEGILATNAQIALYGLVDRVVADSVGNIYIPDYFNNRIRKMDTFGIIHTIAGTGTGGYNGENIAATAAQIMGPSNVYLDKTGNIYFCERLNYRIRKINTSGIISTYAGTGIQGYSGDNGLATLATLGLPTSNCQDTLGNMIIADADHIRYIKANVEVPIFEQNKTVEIIPNPNKGVFTVKLPDEDREGIQIKITNSLGETIPFVYKARDTRVELTINELKGIYFLNIRTQKNNYTNKIFIY